MRKLSKTCACPHHTGPEQNCQKSFRSEPRTGNGCKQESQRIRKLISGLGKKNFEVLFSLQLCFADATAESAKVWQVQVVDLTAQNFPVRQFTLCSLRSVCNYVCLLLFGKGMPAHFYCQKSVFGARTRQSEKEPKVQVEHMLHFCQCVFFFIILLCKVCAKCLILVAMWMKEYITRFFCFAGLFQFRRFFAAFHTACSVNKCVHKRCTLVIVPS